MTRASRPGWLPNPTRSYGRWITLAGVLVVFSTVVLGWQLQSRLVATETERVRHMAQLYLETTGLAAAVALGDEETISRNLRTLALRIPDLVAAVVVDPSGQLMGQSTESATGADARVDPAGLLVEVPIEGVGGVIGLVRLSVSTTRIDNVLASLWLGAGIVAFLGAGLALLGLFTIRNTDSARKITEESFRSLVEQNPDGILILCRDAVVYANPQLLSMLGVGSMEDLSGHKLLEEMLRGPLPESGLGDTYKIRLDSRGTTATIIDVIEVPIVFEQRPARLAILRDVTEVQGKQATVQAADRMTAMGTIAAGVAHEINNPLAYVILNLQIARQRLGQLDDEEFRELGDLSEALSDAAEGAERVRLVVRDLKSFTRVHDETTADLDLHKLLDSSANILSAEIRHRARLVKDYQAVPAVTANEGRLGQVFINLLHNAAQAIPEGRAEENQIRIVTRTAPDGRAVIEVHDTGCGIPTEDLSRIFDAFYTTKPIGVGTGLGLSICGQIVSALGGSIDVQSTVSKGTVMQIVLPAAEEKVALEVPVAATSAVEPACRVLVVEDEEKIAATLSRALSPPHHVELAGSGREALVRLVSDDKFDVILCDLMMPDMTGMQVFEELEKAGSYCLDRFVFMTGGAFTASARQFLARSRMRYSRSPLAMKC